MPKHSDEEGSSNNSEESEAEAADEYKPAGKRKLRKKTRKQTRKVKVKKKQKINKPHSPVTKNVDNEAICVWCNKTFANMGNLTAHMKLHSVGDNIRSLPKQKPRPYKCNVCNETASDSTNLNYHIRKAHYNLKGKVPPFEFKKVNQVWFEKVLNSDIIMELRKTGNNMLVMRKLAPTTGIKVVENYQPDIDLTRMYNIQHSYQRYRKKCPYCPKSVLGRSLKKHIDEKHLNLTKYNCNNCNASFKRMYLYLKHVCFNFHNKKLKGDLVIIDS